MRANPYLTRMVGKKSFLEMDKPHHRRSSGPNSSIKGTQKGETPSKRAYLPTLPNRIALKAHLGQDKRNCQSNSDLHKRNQERTHFDKSQPKLIPTTLHEEFHLKIREFNLLDGHHRR